MKHSLRCRLKDLKSWKLITDGECESLCKALDDMEQHNKDVLEQISNEVNKLKKVSDGNRVYVGINDVFDIIDKYKEDKE